MGTDAPILHAHTFFIQPEPRLATRTAPRALMLLASRSNQPLAVIQLLDRLAKHTQNVNYFYVCVNFLCVEIPCQTNKIATQTQKPGEIRKPCSREGTNATFARQKKNPSPICTFFGDAFCLG